MAISDTNLKKLFNIDMTNVVNILKSRKTFLKMNKTWEQILETLSGVSKENVSERN